MELARIHSQWQGSSARPSHFLYAESCEFPSLSMVNYVPSINSARYAQRIIQTESPESPSFLRKVHRLDPPGGDTQNTRPAKSPGISESLQKSGVISRSPGMVKKTPGIEVI